MTWPGSLRSTCHSPFQHCFHAGSLKALQHTFQKGNTILSPCTLSCLCCLSSLLHLRIHQGFSIRSLFLPSLSPSTPHHGSLCMACQIKAPPQLQSQSSPCCLLCSSRSVL